MSGEPLFDHLNGGAVLARKLPRKLR